jgi:hypothetical protein
MGATPDRNAMCAKNKSGSKAKRTTDVSLESKLFNWLEESCGTDDTGIFSRRVNARILASQAAASEILKQHMTKPPPPESSLTLESLPEFWRGLVLSESSFPDKTDYYASIRALCIVHEIVAEVLKPYIKASLLTIKVPGTMREFEARMRADLPSLLGEQRHDKPLMDEASETPPPLMGDQDLPELIQEMRNWRDDRAVLRVVLLLSLLSRIGGHAALQYWLERPNVILAGSSPAQLIGRGEWAEVADLADRMLTCSPA